MLVADSDLLNDCLEKANLASANSNYFVSQVGTNSEFSCLLRSEEMHYMVACGLRRLLAAISQSSKEVLLSKLWSNEFISLRSLHQFQEKFGSVSGEINVKEFGQNHTIAKYYTEYRTYRQNNSIGLRGPKYFLGVDDRLSLSNRIELTVSELYSAVEAIESIDRENLDKCDLLPYLGILDNAKQHALTLFNAFIFAERRDGIPSDSRYLHARSVLFDVAAKLTRSFYEASFGRTFSTSVCIKDVFDVEYYISKYSGHLDPKGLKIQELDHPLKIILASYNLSKYASTESVVGFPSGSTQLSIVTAMCNEIVNDKQPRSIDILYFPISEHSGINNKGAQPIANDDLFKSVSLFKNCLEGRNVLIVDDNASTGSTISRAMEVLFRFNPLTISTGVAEMDPQRMMIRAKIASQQQTRLLSVNLNHAAFDSAVGVNPISGCDEQLRKCYALKVLGINRI